jgi:chromosome segregation ATPase
VWLPPLRELVATTSDRFGRYMRNMDCTGEVRLVEADDYAEWGIEIRVAFRSTETLQTLTAQRQSGGERSVATICYLMAIQELASAPFRVVDEINQGMDQRNERKIHEMLVRTSCHEDTAQYFLVTPKLLPDLFYHEKMNVLCVMNGRGVPKASDWSPAHFARKMRRLA